MDAASCHSGMTEVFGRPAGFRRRAAETCVWFCRGVPCKFRLDGRCPPRPGFQEKEVGPSPLRQRLSQDLIEVDLRHASGSVERVSIGCRSGHLVGATQSRMIATIEWFTHIGIITRPQCSWVCEFPRIVPTVACSAPAGSLKRNPATGRRDLFPVQPDRNCLSHWTVHAVSSLRLY